MISVCECVVVLYIIMQKKMKTCRTAIRGNWKLVSATAKTLLYRPLEALWQLNWGSCVYGNVAASLDLGNRNEVWREQTRCSPTLVRTSRYSKSRKLP